jgi:hypothetical protein
MKWMDTGKRRKVLREFDTGATRDSDETKIDPEGFLHPDVLLAYCEYMNRHRVQADGSKRDSDNWQKGMDIGVYMKSLLRHVFSLWRSWRVNKTVNMDECCAILFNIMGCMFESLKEKKQRENFIEMVGTRDPGMAEYQWKPRLVSDEWK